MRQYEHYATIYVEDENVIKDYLISKLVKYLRLITCKQYEVYCYYDEYYCLYDEDFTLVYQCDTADEMLDYVEKLINN